MIKAIKIVIIEDEVAAARRLQRILQESGIVHEVVAVLESVEDSLNYFKFGKIPDLILSDIHLADGNCFNIFRQLEIKIPVIFTTAFDQYAINAFKVNSIDYLLKPIQIDELRTAINKFKDQQPDFLLFEKLKPYYPEANTYQQRFVIKSGNKYNILDTNNIALCYADEKLVFALSYDHQKAILDFSLDKLEQLLDPSQFFRINRKVIIHVKSIKNMALYFRGKIKLGLSVNTDIETIVSAERADDFKSWIEKGTL